jgi:hypothetical protein
MEWLLVAILLILLEIYLKENTEKTVVEHLRQGLKKTEFDVIEPETTIQELLDEIPTEEL